MRRLFAALALLAAAQAQAAISMLSDSLAAWEAALAGAAYTTQDFTANAVGDSFFGAEVMPGVTATTNLGRLEVFGDEKSLFAFSSGASSRVNGDAPYEFVLGNAFRAFAFDIAAFEASPPEPGGAVDAGRFEVLLADGSLLSLGLEALASGANLFIGITSDTAITRVRWYEAHEASGGNEETALDTLRLALPTRTVPVPSTLLLAVAALAVLAGRRR